jgi:Domain of unknown function (DUF4406)
MRLYIAGPMTGMPDYNYPAFRATAEGLRAAGYEIECPAENDPPESGLWADWLRLGLAQVLRSDGIATLDGWQESRGARLEVHVATELGMPVRDSIHWRRNHHQ